MTFEEHQEQLLIAIDSATKLIPLLKTSKQINEVQVMLDSLTLMLRRRSTDTNSGIFAQPSSSQCIGEGIQ